MQGGISSKAAGGVINKKKFNEIEYNTDFDINTYDAFYQNLDPQIGRFLQIDPKPSDMESPYVALGNNPIFNIDPLGDTIILSKAFRANETAMEAFELYKNTSGFKEQFGDYDVANGLAGNERDGDQAANTNIVFELFDNKVTKAVTELTLENSNGEQTELYKVDKSQVKSNTKAELKVSIDPIIHNTRTGYALALNHEGSVHAVGLLKALLVLRNNGASDFFKEIKDKSSFNFGKETTESFKGKYLGYFAHGQLAAGANNLYNQISKEIRNQLSPTEKKAYDMKVSSNLKSYPYELGLYRSFIK